MDLDRKWGFWPWLHASPNWTTGNGETDRPMMQWPCLLSLTVTNDVYKLHQYSPRTPKCWTEERTNRQRVWQSITADSGSTRQHALFEGLMHQQGSHVGQTSH